MQLLQIIGQVSWGYCMTEHFFSHLFFITSVLHFKRPEKSFYLTQ